MWPLRLALPLVMLTFRAVASTYTVTNTHDSGAGSLRQAMIDANASVGADTIAFAIPGAGAQTIVLASELPAITDMVTIDATTQPGYTGTPLIVVRGVHPWLGFQLQGPGGSVVRGLAISGFSYPLRINSSGNLFTANYVGVSPSGDGEETLGWISVTGSGNVIGGTTEGAGNVTTTIIELYDAPNTIIARNRIGVNAAGTAAFSPYPYIHVDPGSDATTISTNVMCGSITLWGNSGAIVEGNRIGVDVSGMQTLSCAGEISVKGTGHRIGGATAAQKNILRGRVGVYDGEGHEVLGNHIGVAADGATPLPFSNGRIILFPEYGGKNVRIGGIAPGEGNVLNNGNTYGVRIAPESTGITVRGNTMVRASDRDDAILLDPFAYPNDTGDPDTGANNQQNRPVLQAAIAYRGNVTVRGFLESTPSTTFAVDFYANTSCAPVENRIDYVSSATVQTDASGRAEFSVVIPTNSTSIIATATSPQGDTSAFSQCISAQAADIPALSTTMLIALAAALAAAAVFRFR